MKKRTGMSQDVAHFMCVHCGADGRGAIWRQGGIATVDKHMTSVHGLDARVRRDRDYLVDLRVPQFPFGGGAR